MNRFPFVLAAALLWVGCVSAQSPSGESGSFQATEGKASYYADKFVGRTTANGETYTHRKMTAAHRTLPFGTRVRVTRLDTGASVVVRINDRGPFVRGRIIDLSKGAAERLGMIADGVVGVRIEPADGSSPAPQQKRPPDATRVSW